MINKDGQGEYSDVVFVEATGWEWNCPNCNTLHSLWRSEYVPSMPVTCINCGEEYLSQTDY